MTLSLSDAVAQILEVVKTTTGKEVQFVERNDLQTYAAVKIARRSMPAHLMLYKPEHSGVINHLVAHECGHILRMFSVAEEQRLVPMTNKDMKMVALTTIEPEIQDLSRVLPFEGLAQIVNMWFEGTVRQLTNFPSDIRIEKWIHDNYPDLVGYQAKSLHKQYDEAVQGLTSRVAKMSPRTILQASNVMNYAFFSFLATHTGDATFLRRYGESRYARKGRELLETLSACDDNYQGDVDAVNRWAEMLGLSRWFGWTRFEDVPGNYLDAV